MCLIPDPDEACTHLGSTELPVYMCDPKSSWPLQGFCFMWISSKVTKLSTGAGGCPLVQVCTCLFISLQDYWESKGSSERWNLAGVERSLFPVQPTSELDPMFWNIAWKDAEIMITCWCASPQNLQKFLPFEKDICFPPLQVFTPEDMVDFQPFIPYIRQASGFMLFSAASYV